MSPTTDTSDTNTLTTFVVWDESGHKVTIHATSAKEAAQAYVESGDWDESSQSVFHDVYVDDGEDTSSHTIVVDPLEPPCAEDDGHDEHDWVEVGVRGNGGGVIVEERCRNCGLRKVTDTWAHNPSNGEQGFTTIQYLEAIQYLEENE